MDLILRWDRSYLRRVPAFDTNVASDAGEASDSALILPAVLGNQPVGTV